MVQLCPLRPLEAHVHTKTESKQAAQVLALGQLLSVVVPRLAWAWHYPQKTLGNYRTQSEHGQECRQETLAHEAEEVEEGEQSVVAAAAESGHWQQ